MNAGCFLLEGALSIILSGVRESGIGIRVSGLQSSASLVEVEAAASTVRRRATAALGTPRRLR